MDNLPPANPEHFQHSTATVEPGAQIGPGVRIWHYTHVRAGASIGAGTQLGMNVYVDAVIGSRVKIQNNVTVGRGVVLEDDVFVGPNAVFVNDLHPRAFGDWSLATTVVRRGGTVGAGAVVLGDLEIGQFAMVAAGAVVTHDVAPHALVLGNPARQAGWVCRCGATVSRAAEQPASTWCGNCTFAEEQP